MIRVIVFSMMHIFLCFSGLWAKNTAHSISADHIRGNGYTDIGLSDILLIDAPTLLSPANNTVVPLESPVLCWSMPASSTPIVFQLQVSLNNTFSEIVFNDTTLADTVIELQSLNYLTKYFWHVRAKNQSAWGNYSVTFSFTTEADPTIPVPAAPVINFPINDTIITFPNPKFEWSRQGDQFVDTYHFQLSSDSSFRYLMYEDSTLTDEYDQYSVDPGRYYYWRVQAMNKGGKGPFSTTGKFSRAISNPLYSDPAFFPFNIGDLWCYSATDTTPNAASIKYLVIKRIIERLSEAEWLTEVKTIYSDTMITTYEPWIYYDGTFSGNGRYENFRTEGYNYYQLEMGYRSSCTLWAENLFGKAYEAQEYGYSKAYTVPPYESDYKTAKYLGLYYSYYKNVRNSSMKIYSLRGARIGNTSFGDTLWYTDTKKSDPILPQMNNLRQNYPNPFNPTTTIEFTLADDGFVSLKVYDILGREVTKLIAEFRKAGGYKVIFNAAQLSTGIYVYKLSASGFTSFKKLMIVK